MNDFIVKKDGSKSMIHLENDLTALNVPFLKELLKKEIDDNVAELVFDFMNTKIIDSTGIGILVAAYNSVNKIGGTITIINSSKDIKQLLQSMRLAERLNLN